MALHLEHLDEDSARLRLVLVDEVGRVGVELDLDRGAGVGQLAELGDHQPGDGLVVTARQVVVDGTLDLVDVHVAAHHPDPVVVHDGLVRSVRVVLVGDLPDELLGQVLHGEDAGEAAELVHDARQLVARAAQLAHGIRQRHEGGDDHGRADELADVGVQPVLRGQHVLEVDHADDPTGVVEHGVAGVLRAHQVTHPVNRVAGAHHVHT